MRPTSLKTIFVLYIFVDQLTPKKLCIAPDFEKSGLTQKPGFLTHVVV